MIAIERKPPNVRALRDNVEVWHGRTDAVPRQYICYTEGKTKMATPIDRATDEQLVYALERISN